MKEITAILHGARRVALVSHRDPDPDTIGSALALGLGLESLGKVVSWHCADPVPEQQRFLFGSDRFTQQPPPEDVDLVVTVDFGSIERAKFALPARPTLVNIDHHASNDHFGSANLVDATSAASAELVSRVIDALGIELGIAREHLVHQAVDEVDRLGGVQRPVHLAPATGSADRVENERFGHRVCSSEMLLAVCQ